MTSLFDPKKKRMLIERMATARHARGSIEQIAAEVGIHRSQISRFEAGQFKRISKNLQKLLDYLQIDPEEGIPPDLGSLHARIDALAKKQPQGLSILATLFDALEALAAQPEPDR